MDPDPNPDTDQLRRLGSRLATVERRLAALETGLPSSADNVSPAAAPEPSSDLCTSAPESMVSVSKPSIPEALPVVGRTILVIGGGIDKRVLARSLDDIDRMCDRILPTMRRRGGYIPTCDHGVPPEVPWQSFLHYRERCVELGGQ